MGSSRTKLKKNDIYDLFKKIICDFIVVKHKTGHFAYQQG